MLEQQNKIAEQDLKVYRVQGLSCTNCAATFEKNVKLLPGVEDAKVNFGASKIYVKGDTTIEDLERAGAFENLMALDVAVELGGGFNGDDGRLRHGGAPF